MKNKAKKKKQKEVAKQKALKETPDWLRDAGWELDALASKGERKPLGIPDKKVTKMTSTYKACHETHEPLSLGNGLVIHGGSCIHPKVPSCDVYIGFDHGMHMTTKGLPWTGVREVPYYITDMSIPSTPELFKKLVQWTIEQVQAGKKVHAGCIGGHGRTGMFFAAIVATLGISDDPISYVREQYCHKAVESDQQVQFLVKQFKCKTVKGTKSSYGGSNAYTTGRGYDGDYGSSKNETWWTPPGKKIENPVVDDTFQPVQHAGKIW